MLRNQVRLGPFWSVTYAFIVPLESLSFVRYRAHSFSSLQPTIYSLLQAHSLYLCNLFLLIIARFDACLFSA